MNCLYCRTATGEGGHFCTACVSAVTADTQAATMASAALPTVGGITDNNEMTIVRADRLMGRLFDAKYELFARLGTGGMGTVYRARRVYVGDEVAIKVLHQNRLTRPEAVERFRREARAVAMLCHPNVVTVYDYREMRGESAQTYLVMELAQGTTLSQLLKRVGRLAPTRAIALMRDICAGVGAAHQRGIVHRDLKPDNIIVAPPRKPAESETVKVVDFGIAKLSDPAAAPLTQAGMVIGTPYYMSPEQCLGEELDARSDVYSLGIMLYEMLAGRRPFMAPTPTGVIAKHLTEAPPPLPNHMGLPSGLEAVLLRALAKDPAARPADANAFAQELQTALSPAATAPAPKQAPGKLIAYAMIAALMLLSVGLGTQTSLAGLEPREPSLKATLVNPPSGSAEARSQATGVERKSTRAVVANQNRHNVSKGLVSGGKVSPTAAGISHNTSPLKTPRGARNEPAVSVTPKPPYPQAGGKVVYLSPKLRGTRLQQVLAQLTSNKSNGKVTVVYVTKKKKKD
jgi:serine/threonine protein kinase